MIHIDQYIVSAKARIMLAEMQSPPGATVRTGRNQDGTVSLMYILGTNAVEIDDIPPYVDPNDLNHVLGAGIAKLCMVACRSAAQRAWAQRPWWVTLCALIGWEWLGDRWIKGRVHVLMEELWKIPPPKPEPQPPHPTVQ